MKRNCLIAILTLALFFPASGVPAEKVPPEVVKAAEDGLQCYLGLIPPGENEDYGFAPGDDFARAEVSAPFLLHKITPSALEAYRPGRSIASVISSTETWYFPVQIDGEAKTILTVGRIKGSPWQAVGIGGAPLSRELQKMRERWPASRGYNPRLVVVYQAATYFFTVPEVSKTNLTPLIFTGEEIGADTQRKGPRYSTLSELSQFAGKLKSAVRENIEQSRR